MKNLFISILFCSALCGCENFLDRSPLDKIGDETYWKTESDLKYYVNQFYDDLPGYGGYDAGLYWKDCNSDNMIYSTYDNRLAGYTVVPSESNDWSWGNIRAVNHFLQNFNTVKDQGEEVDQYIGEAYFFRAYFYFDLLKKYGDLPWVNKVLQENDAELYAPRLSRTIIADSIIMDLSKAASLMQPASDINKNRINCDVANLLLSEVSLYEGTWEKYHHGTAFGSKDEKIEYFLKKAVESTSTVIESGRWSIYTEGEDPYFNLFNKENYTDHPEVMLAKLYDENLNMTHRSQLYLLLRGSGRGVTKSLVDDYLCSDGKPLAAHPERGNKTLSEIVQNRDKRLAQTIWIPGDIRRSVGESVIYFEKPDIDKSGENQNLTGFQIKKGADPYVVDENKCMTGLVIYRYANVLLNYAEAKAELGTINQEDIDKTINVLRARADIAPLKIDAIYNDPNWIFKSISPLLNEIRRERRVELACEGSRFDDLMRWRAHDVFVNQRPKGMFFNQEEFPDIEVGVNIFVDENGLIDPYQKSLSGGFLFNPNRDYLLPIPTKELTLNENFKQNPGWN